MKKIFSIILCLTTCFSLKAQTQVYRYEAVAVAVGTVTDVPETYQWTDWMETEIPVFINPGSGLVEINSTINQRFIGVTAIQLPLFTDYPLLRKVKATDSEGKVCSLVFYRDEDGVRNICIHYSDIALCYCLLPY